MKPKRLISFISISPKFIVSGTIIFLLKIKVSILKYLEISTKSEEKYLLEGDSSKLNTFSTFKTRDICFSESLKTICDKQYVLYINDLNLGEEEGLFLGRRYEIPKKLL
ncbi:hypothetical protein BpHYR1_019662 [Brachionus plicatilis]|uniref:Uncharacterized protein n=1 Tax=Brachionus plicatilis TaxID=10195 RepID=A0A3M7PST7_BRAPC|nr:hypothetical protein BpHYR1_019662 [Brachionus plicatilis]